MRIIIALICLVIGYFIGVFLPFNIRPEIVDKPLTIGEYYYYTVTTFGVFATFLTVIVALFKNDIIRLFKRVRFKFDFMEGKELHEETENIQGTKKAIKYYSVSNLQNIGNISADNCKLFIDKIVYASDVRSDIILAESKPISLFNSKESVYIPSQGKIPLHLFELLQPQKSSTPDGQRNDTPPKLKILGFSDITVEKGGEWRCSYSFHSSSMQKPQYFEVKISWDGNWEHRLTEMNSNLKVELKQL